MTILRTLGGPSSEVTFRPVHPSEQHPPPTPRVIVPEAPSIIVPGRAGDGGSGNANTLLYDGTAEPTFDFISEYTSWADVMEIPREIHASQGIQLVASLLNYNRVFIRHSDFEYPLDLWQLLLTESGGGRSSIIRGVKRLLRAAGLGGYVKDSDWGSVPAMIQHFADNSFSLLYWSEFSERLEFFNKQGGKRWFTDRYDDTELPDSRTYRRNSNSSTNTPPILFSQSPRINITAASSDGWFFENMGTGDSTGGFLPRWMLIRTGKMKDVPTPPPLDKHIQAELVERLKHIAKITGEADISEILPLYEAWYTPTRERFEKASQNFGRIYFSRHRGLALKLSVVYEVSRSGSLRVSSTSWDRAVVTARQLENTLFELLDTGMNQYGWEITQVENLIREAGPQGISQHELNRALRGMKDADKHLWKLFEEEVIRKVKRQPSRGRPATFYLHRDCDAEG